MITAIVDDMPALDHDHGVLQCGSFYTEEVNGEELVDWVTRLIEGGPVDDVHCTECTAGWASPPSVTGRSTAGRGGRRPRRDGQAASRARKPQTAMSVIPTA